MHQMFESGLRPSKENTSHIFYWVNNMGHSLEVYSNTVGTVKIDSQQQRTQPCPDPGTAILTLQHQSASNQVASNPTFSAGQQQRTQHTQTQGHIWTFQFAESVWVQREGR